MMGQEVMSRWPVCANCKREAWQVGGMRGKVHACDEVHSVADYEVWSRMKDHFIGWLEAQGYFLCKDCVGPNFFGPQPEK